MHLFPQGKDCTITKWWSYRITETWEKLYIWLEHVVDDKVILPRDEGEDWNVLMVILDASDKVEFRTSAVREKQSCVLGKSWILGSTSSLGHTWLVSRKQLVQ